MKDVRTLIAVFQEMGNPFLENTQDLLVLDTRDIMDTPAAETVRKIESLGEEQYTKFVEERLELCTKPVTDTSQEQVATLQSVTVQDAIKAANATRRSEE